MNVVDHPSPGSPAEKLSIERFEVIAQAAAPEDVTLEYLNGQLQIRAVAGSGPVRTRRPGCPRCTSGKARRHGVFPTVRSARA